MRSYRLIDSEGNTLRFYRMARSGFDLRADTDQPLAALPVKGTGLHKATDDDADVIQGDTSQGKD